MVQLLSATLLIIYFMTQKSLFSGKLSVLDNTTGMNPSNTSYSYISPVVLAKISADSSLFVTETSQNIFVDVQTNKRTDTQTL